MLQTLDTDLVIQLAKHALAAPSVMVRRVPAHHLVTLVTLRIASQACAKFACPTAHLVPPVESTNVTLVMSDIHGLAQLAFNVVQIVGLAQTRAHLLLSVVFVILATLVMQLHSHAVLVLVVARVVMLQVQLIVITLEDVPPVTP